MVHNKVIPVFLHKDVNKIISNKIDNAFNNSGVDKHMKSDNI